MRRSLVKFSGPEASNHTPSLADFIITKSGFRFSVHTGAMNMPSARSIYVARSLPAAIDALNEYVSAGAPFAGGN